MKINDARQRFVETWGALASQWGISRAMAQLHAYLLVSPVPVSVEQLMEELQMSRGSVSTNVRDLIDWGIVRRTVVSGERKDFFVAEKDLMVVARKIVQERRKREIQPVIESLTELHRSTIQGPKSEVEAFTTMMKQIVDLTTSVSEAADIVTKAPSNWLLSLLTSLRKR